MCKIINTGVALNLILIYLQIGKCAIQNLKDLRNWTFAFWLDWVALTRLSVLGIEYSANVDTMLAHRLRRWPTVVPTLAERLVFAGMGL